MSDAPKIFTLKQVVNSIRKTIEDRYHQTYWVKAEMHKLNRFPSGHCFPELLQKEDGKIVAQISGSIWKHNFDRINQRFVQVVKEPLKEDTTLLMNVKVTFHETYGLSLQILDIDPNYALGELQRERQETLKRLQKEGLLNLNQRLSFPLLPKRVAVISAESSKGLSDFMQILDRNEWGYTFFTMLFQSYLQGDLAANSIISQLQRIERVKEHFDVVVIVRGGGGEVGLSCYNNYELCKAITQFPLPILTGIGHSTNLTVAEMVAFRNAITPTELADFLLQGFHNFAQPVEKAGDRLISSAQRILATTKSALAINTAGFKHGTKQYISSERFQLSSLSKAIQTETNKQLALSKSKIMQCHQQLKSGIQTTISHRSIELKNSRSKLPISSKTIFVQAKSRLDHLTQVVRLTDPINVLKRGYSITTMNGKTISEINRVKPGDLIQTKTATFTLESHVVNTTDE